MLAETRTELDEFHASSKELEEELERELERTEKAQQDLKVKVARAERERDEWKVCTSRQYDYMRITHGIPSPNSCRCRRPTTRPRRRYSVNLTHYALNIRRSRFNSES